MGVGRLLDTLRTMDNGEPMAIYRWPVLVLATALVTLGGICGTTIPIHAADAPRPTLRIHNWEDYLAPQVVAEFERRFNAKIEVVTFSDEEEALEHLSRAGAPFDLMVLSGSAVRRAREASLLGEIDPLKIPNLKNVDKAFRMPFYDTQAKSHVPYLWGTTGIVVNRTRIKEPGKGWEVLWDQGLKGKIAMLNSPEEVVGAALKSMGYSMNSVETAQLERARERLLAQKPLLAGYLESTEIRDRLVSGKLWAAQIYSGDAMAAIEKNTELAYIIPTQGAARWVDNLVIPANARNRDLALAFMNFILEPEIGALNASEMGSASPNAAAVPFMDKELLANPAVYPPDEIAARLETLSERGASAERDARRNFVGDVWAQLTAKKKR